MGAWLKGVRALFVGFAGLCAAGAASAQTIAPGGTINGQLASSDQRASGGQYQDVYTLRGQAGQALRIEMTSSSMDSLVRITGPGNFTAQDDDSGGNLNARLEVTLPASGEYRIAATTFGADVTGNYMLRVSEIAATDAPREASGGALQLGQIYSGALASGDRRASGGQFEDTYTFTGRAGQTLRVTMESTQLDSLVRVRGPGNFTAEDDDSGGRLNAMLDITLPANGQYQVIATSYDAGASGAYRLRVAEFDPRTAASSAAATGSVRVGQTINGALQRGDPTRSSGQFADAYTFQGQANQTIEVRMNSGAFDPFLSITGPGNFQIDNDDDMQSNEPLRNSRIVVTLPQSGEYRIQATSFATGATGNYSLSVGQGSSSNAAQASAGQIITVGRPATGRLQQGDGTLRSGEFVDSYRFLGQAGQRIAIELRSSEFDPYLLLRTPSGEQTDNDDGEGMGTNSRIEMTLTETGEYGVHATSYQPGESGAYQLVITDLGAAVRPDAPPAASSGGTGALALRSGQAASGQLARGDNAFDDGRLYDLYSFSGRRGQNLNLEVTSSAFDTYLVLLTPSGEMIEDDDGVAGSTNSRLAGGLPEDGDYLVAITSYSSGQGGAYRVNFSLGGSAQATAPAGQRQAAASGQGGRVFLLSVGISDYAGFSSNLAYTAEDAQNLYTALRASGSLAEGSVVLTDAQATMANVRAAFQRIASQLGPNDLFFFFYSGHGGQQPAGANSNELDGREEFLVLRDGYLTDDEVGRMFAGLRSRLSIIALDACFSGGFARDVVTNPRIMGLFSSDEDLTSAVAGKFQAGGYLSHFLRTGLHGEADENSDGIITAGELHSYLWRRFAAEQNIGARSMDGERNYQRLVVERGGVKVDDMVIALGR